MPRYFMHLRDGTDELLDEDGIELPADAVPRVALEAARDCIAGDLVTRGRIDLGTRIDVYDEQNAMVHTLSFADAVKVVPA